MGKGMRLKEIMGKGMRLEESAKEDMIICIRKILKPSLSLHTWMV